MREWLSNSSEWGVYRGLSRGREGGFGGCWFVDVLRFAILGRFRAI